MKLIDQFEKDGVIDRYTFVFDEINDDGSNTMLAMSEGGYAFSQWTSGVYDSEGKNKNEHLGRHIELRDLGNVALNAFFSRLSIPREWEELHDVVEQIIHEDGDE